MTRSEYEEIVNAIVTAERDRLLESLNAVFDQEGHNLDTFIWALTKAVESQPAVTANVVSQILEKTGLLPLDN